MNLAGIHFDNGLDTEISDIEVISCVSDKYAGADITGIFSYATDYRTMDTTSSDGWRLRQTVKCKIFELNQEGLFMNFIIYSQGHREGWRKRHAQLQ